MNNPKKYKITIEVLKELLIIKKNNLGQVKPDAIKKIKKMIKNLKAVLVILEGR